MSRLQLPSLVTPKDILQIFEVRSMKQIKRRTLLDPRLINRCVTNIGKYIRNCFVIHLQPGVGSFTRALLESKVRGLALIESDRRFMPLLQRLRESSSVPFTIYEANPLDFDFETLEIPENFVKTRGHRNSNICIFSCMSFGLAIQYLIKTLRLISLKAGIYTKGRVPLVVILQKEVAMQLKAEVGNHQRGRLSVMTQCFCNIEHCDSISGKAFFPPAEVETCIMSLTPKRSSIANSENVTFSALEKVVGCVFKQKNKKLITTLKSLFPNAHKDALAERIIQESKVLSDINAYNVTVAEFVEITKCYEKILKEFPEIQ